MVQTYRAYETGLSRHDKLQVAQALADLNDRLVQVLRRQMEANQAPAADVVFSEVEDLAARQQVEAAQLDYIDALAALRETMGLWSWPTRPNPRASSKHRKTRRLATKRPCCKRRSRRGPKSSRPAPGEPLTHGLALGRGRPDSDSFPGAGL